MSSENFREYPTTTILTSQTTCPTTTPPQLSSTSEEEPSRYLAPSSTSTLIPSSEERSETWQEDAEKPVFIDRNGDLFSQVLDFMRYGSIELSSATPKSMFDRELDFYGITAEEGSVQHQSLAKVTEEFSCWKSKCDMFRLALECYHQYGLRSGEVQVRICKDHALFSTDHITEEEREMLCLYLDVYFGLVMPAENSDTFNRNWFYVCRKE
eukprot:scaffold1630_cov228-Alexandrium_tamarense.AAC.7